MTPIRLTATLLLVFGLWLPSLAHAQALRDRGPIDAIVAIVEEDIVLRSELDQAVANVRRQFAGQVALPPADVLERQVLERLVMQRLQLQRAAAGGIRVSDAELDAAIARIASGNNMNLTQFRRAVEADGFNWEEFRQTVREEMTIDMLRARVARSRVEVSDTEIDLLLASDSFNQDELRLAHILVALPDGASSEQIRIAREKAEGIVKLIDEGMAFAAAAIRYSDGPQALDGGDLGWRRLDQVPPGFVEAVQGLEIGQYTPPLRGPGGFHIIQLADRRSQSQFIVTEYNARHLMIRSSELVTPNEARARLLAALDEIRAGADFAEVARRVSEDETTAALGGDMGWFPLEAYGQGVAQALQTIGDGEISAPFQTTAGWHVVQRLGTRQRDRTEEFLREQARESIFARKAEEEVENWMRQLRSESFVETRLARN